jgi:hypothetical protein
VITVWKYPLRITDTQPVNMPEGAQILSVQFQGEALCLWALVDTHKPQTQRIIRIIGTGNPIVEYGTAPVIFIGTVQQFGGQLVWHVFERI